QHAVVRGVQRVGQRRRRQGERPQQPAGRGRQQLSLHCILLKDSDGESLAGPLLSSYLPAVGTGGRSSVHRVEGGGLPSARARYTRWSRFGPARAWRASRNGSGG